MQKSKCLFNSATALRRVFLSAAVASDATIIQQQTSCQFLRSAHQLIQPLRHPFSGSRRFSAQPVQFRIARNSGYLAAERAELENANANKLPRDSQIRTPFVLIISENGLSRPTPTRDVLADLDPRYESLVMVAWGSKDGVDEDGRPRHKWPVCKIVDLQKEREEQYRKKKEERKKHVESKELEINWGIAGNDLEMTKLRPLRKFLAKGFKVQVRLVNKSGRGRKQISKEDADCVVSAIQAAAAEIPGSQVSKTEGEVGKVMTIIFQGPAKGYKPPAPPTKSAAAPSTEAVAESVAGSPS